MKVWMYLRLAIGLLFRKRLHFILLTTIHRFKVVFFSVFCSICLKSGNMKPLVAKWPCCFKDIFIYIYIYIYTWFQLILTKNWQGKFHDNNTTVNHQALNYTKASEKCPIALLQPEWYTNINSLRPSEHICVGDLTIIGPDNGLSPGRHQAIILTNAALLLILP